MNTNIHNVWNTTEELTNYIEDNITLIDKTTRSVDMSSINKNRITKLEGRCLSFYKVNKGSVVVPVCINVNSPLTKPNRRGIMLISNPICSNARYMLVEMEIRAALDNIKELCMGYSLLRHFGKEIIANYKCYSKAAVRHYAKLNGEKCVMDERAAGKEVKKVGVNGWHITRPSHLPRIDGQTLSKYLLDKLVLSEIDQLLKYVEPDGSTRFMIKADTLPSELQRTIADDWTDEHLKFVKENEYRFTYT